jgi:predicted GTPase
MSAAQDPVDAKKLEEIGDLLKRALAERPPAFGLVGVSGVGKSSTVNALFRLRFRRLRRDRRSGWFLGSAGYCRA